MDLVEELTTMKYVKQSIRKRVNSLRPAPENELIYNEIDLRDPQNVELRESISTRGLLDPLLCAKCGTVFSGNRRLAVLKSIGQKVASCIQFDFEWEDLPVDEKVNLLRECNRQRNKDIGEQVREALIDCNHDAAVRNLHRRRQQSENGYRLNGNAVPLLIDRRGYRHEISAEKSEHVRYLKQVVNELKQYWPISVRAVHYKLLNYEFARNTRLGLKYRNDDGSYDATGDLKNRLCLSGDLPFEAFSDETRPFKSFPAFQNVRQFVKQEVERLFDGYWRDLQQSQPNYVEVFVEKNTAYNFALSVTKRYQIPTSSEIGRAHV